MKLVKLGITVLLLASAVIQAQEIKWDTWGVPHIKGTTPSDVYYAFGWAQMKAHGNLILTAYGKSRGRAAEYWGGEDHLANDKLYHKLNIPKRAQHWLATQDQDMTVLLQAFVDGMNDYCEKHPDKISNEVKMVLPVKNTDPLSHLQVSYHMGVAAFAMRPQAAEWKTAGSNAWAIGPSRSESGNAMLLTQPHPPWFPDYLFFEGHIMNEDLNLYGISLVGSPSMAMGFNDDLGWALTFNQADAMDLIELEVVDNKYLINGEWKEFTMVEQTIQVKTGESFAEEKIQIKESDFGFVIEEKVGKALALRISGFDRPNFMKQFYEMGRASNLTEFEKATSSLQLPLQNIIYADANGEIFYLYNGIIPKRPNGKLRDWSAIIPASKPGALVREYVEYEDLPKFKNPSSGFVANSNNDPWTSTYPFEIFPKGYDTYITEEPYSNFNYRSTRSIRMIADHKKLNFERLVALQSSTHAELADRTIPELVSFGKSSNESLLQEAARVFEGWDRTLDSKSKGSVLFANWYFSLQGVQKFEVPFSSKDPLNTPRILTKEAKEKLLDAAKRTKDKHGRLDLAWDEVYEINYAGKSFKGGLGLSELGCFNAGFYRPLSDKKYTLLGGSAYTSVVEFGETIKAKGILSYGNASQADSPFHGDQIQLLIDRKLRDIWFYPNDIDNNLDAVENLKR